MRKARGLLVLVGVLGVTGVALATPPPYSNSRYNRASSEYDYAPVTHVEPIVRQVRIETPRRECYDDTRYVESPNPNVGAQTVLGGIIGGVLGHQIGSGRGNDVATGLGAVGGAVVGANVGRSGGSQVYSQDVQRCASVQGSARPDYWDVTYNFRGQQHRVQMATPPGPTVTVNGNGEPRG